MKEFQTNLKTNNEALDYLKITRGLSDLTIENFGLGYDTEKNAIAIPVYKRGELVNIRYRYLSPDAKVRYTQEKDCEVWLYNEDGIQKGLAKGGVLIVEGEFDLMSAWQAGFKNVISPASGKDSYGVWLELLDNIPKVYLSFDNDKPGKDAAVKMSERVGIEKCQEVIYPEGIKDANEYFKKFTAEDYKKLIKDARPFYSYQFKDLGDVINEMRAPDNGKLELKMLPDVKIGSGWMISILADTNVGKTSYVMNVADELANKGLPTLVFPFERGISVVGERFLQVKFNMSEGDFKSQTEEGWDKVIKECRDTPIYFATPDKEELTEMIKKAKRIFGIKAVVVDHLDYLIRRSAQREDIEIRNTLHELKRIAEDEDIVFFIVTHIKNIQTPGAVKKKQPSIDDARGSSAIKQDSECVLVLKNKQEGEITVHVQKNKGKMSEKSYSFNVETGRLGEIVSEGADFDKVASFLADDNDEDDF